MFVHQLVVGFREGDAISNNALTLRKSLNNYFDKPSFIFGDPKHFHFNGQEECFRNYRSLIVKEEDVVIYHYSIGSEISNYFLNLNCKKVLFYHNITPADYFWKFSLGKAWQLLEGKTNLVNMVGKCDLYLAASDFSATDLMDLNMQHVQVMPLLLDYAYLDSKPAKKVLKKKKSGDINIIFVGRVAPNKKIENILKAVYLFKKLICQNVQLHIVGMHSGMEEYMKILKSLARDYGFESSIFTNFVSNEELVSYYQIADLFLCLSEHEGFCVPLVEAMKMQVPVIALNRGAIAETLSYGGILFNKIDYKYLVELMSEVVFNDDLKTDLITKGKQRFQDFNLEVNEKLLYKYLEKVIKYE